MNRRNHIGLGWGLVAWGLLANTPAAAAGEGCPPTVALSGPGEVVRSLTAALVARGVRVEPSEVPPGSCERLAVTLTTSAEGVKVGIVDPWGRSTERTVKELLTSASLIESWARLDLLDGVSTSSAGPVKAAAAPPARAPVVPAEPAPPAPAVGNLETTAAQEVEPNLSLRVLAEGGVARDRSRWMGASIGACAHLGFLCLGLQGRYAKSDRGADAAEGLLILEAPITLGILTLRPGIGAGAGWTREDRSVVMLQRGEQDRELRVGRPSRGDDGFGARAEARLGLSLNLSDHFGVELGASASAIPELRRGARGLFDPEQAVLRAQGGLVWSFE
ncbi:MAG: hypothetical protein IPG45_35430 [Deltaproteobacteria bacterium]|nr:hypothetical protein [Deltaproteobacteria bacterium]